MTQSHLTGQITLVKSVHATSLKTFKGVNLNIELILTVHI